MISIETKLAMEAKIQELEAEAQALMLEAYDYTLQGRRLKAAQLELEALQFRCESRRLSSALTQALELSAGTLSVFA